ncbi:unnamed protein product [Rhizophagus irregularis]|nr:unnamed protein product [Rhizophagus irregularis]
MRLRSSARNSGTESRSCEKSRVNTHAENAALKSKVEDVESRLVKVEQDSSAEQPQNERNQKVASADDVPDSVINTAERSENQSNNASSVDSKN